MAFAHDLQAFAEQAAEKQAYITTEEATKSALIVPFLRVLGYDDANPTEVIPEYIADGGHRKDRKVDYALCLFPADPPQPALIIECKACTHPLRDRHTSQLHRCGGGPARAEDVTDTAHRPLPAGTAATKAGWPPPARVPVTAA